MPINKIIKKQKKIRIKNKSNSILNKTKKNKKIQPIFLNNKMKWKQKIRILIWRFMEILILKKKNNNQRKILQNTN